MASSSSESDIGANNNKCGPFSSPIIDPDYGSYDEDTVDDYEKSDQSSNSTKSTSSDSPRQTSSKRRRYKLYCEDPSASIPRETLRRWNLTSIDQGLSAGNMITPEVGSTSPLPLPQEIEVPQSTTQDSDSDTECEVGSSSSELNYEHGFASDSNSVYSPENSSYQEKQDEDSVISSHGDDTGSMVYSDDSDGNEVLFSGSAKTTDEAVLEVCNLFLKHRWTKATLNDTLKMMASTLPKGNNMPRSLHTLYNYLNMSSAPCSELSYVFCTSCLQLKSDKSDVCDLCSANSNGDEVAMDETDMNKSQPDSGVFYYFSIAEQIKFMFEQNDLSQAIDDYKKVCSRDRDQRSICDILDGTEYKRVKAHTSGQYDIILMFNTDGVSLSESSQVEFYPLLTTICEVEPRLRSHYIMVNSIWVHGSAPCMHTFLKPFVEELTEIDQAGGFEWKHPRTGEIFKTQVFAPLLIGDAPVRGSVLNVMRYNAIYGCEKCEQKAIKLPPKSDTGRSLRRLVFTETPATERTSERMRLQGEYSKSNNKVHVKGVKGKAVVEDIPHLNRASCTLAEYMHSVLLGITRHFTNLWLSKPGAWYIGNRKEAVDDILKSIKVLHFMRCARKMSKIAYFKASEFRSWLLFFSLVVLRKVDFPDHYYQHWILLVKSVYILLQDEISESELLSADVMLRCFLRDVGKLYSNYDYVYNIHQLSHLTTYVRQWGPLSVNSAFLFENYNGVLSRMVHGTKHHAKELSENLKLARCIHVLDMKGNNSADVKTSDSEVSVLGKAGRTILTNDDVDILRSEGIVEFQTYRRASFKRVVYTSLDYDTDRQKCNSIIEFYRENQKHRGEIICFVKTVDKIVCYVEKFKVRQTDIIYHRETKQIISHLLPVDRSNLRVLVEFSCFIRKVFKVGDFTVLAPNKVETRL